MSIRISKYGEDAWEADIRLRLPNGEKIRERVKTPVTSKSAARKWAEARERELLIQGKRKPVTVKEVQRLREFSPRFLADAEANQQKPSTVAAKETILRVHLVPLLGDKPLDQITSEDVQRLKTVLVKKTPKTVNNVLAVLNTLLRTAVEWNVIDEQPCRIRLIRAPKKEAGYHGFDDYESIVEAARVIDPTTYLIVLLGAEAGLRCGEIMALEWAQVDLELNQLAVIQSQWKGHVTAPKGGRIRYVGLTERLASVLTTRKKSGRRRVVCDSEGQPLTQKMVQGAVKRARIGAGLTSGGVHTLRHTFCSHLAMRGAPVGAIQRLAGHQDLTTTQRYMHLSPETLNSAIRLLDRPTASTPGEK